MARQTLERIDSNVRGYLACLLDQNGTASYNASLKRIKLGINRVRDERLREDLRSWMGGWSEIRESDGSRRGCTLHCRSRHIHYSTSSHRWVVTGTRALFVLGTLEPSLRTWNDKFDYAYHKGLENIGGFPQDVFDEMVAKGWDQPT